MENMIAQTLKAQAEQAYRQEKNYMGASGLMAGPGCPPVKDSAIQQLSNDLECSLNELESRVASLGDKLRPCLNHSLTQMNQAERNSRPYGSEMAGFLDRNVRRVHGLTALLSAIQDSLEI